MATPEEFFGTSQNVSAGQFFSGGAVSVVQPQTDDEKLSFAQRFGEDLAKRQKIAEEIKRATNEGEQSFAEGMLQLVGKVGAGSVFDFIGEVLVSGGRGLSAIMPDTTETLLKVTALTAAYQFLNTDIGKLGLEAAKLGIPAYQKFAESNPRSARNIEAVVNIGLLAAPVSRSASPSMIRTSGEGWLARTAGRLEGAAGAQETARRASFVDDLITPKATAKVRLDRTGRTVEEGVLKQKVVALSPAEQRISAEIAVIPGVVQSNTLQGNMNVIRTELGNEAGRLATILKDSPVRISRTEVQKSLELARRNLERVPTLTGDAAKTADRLVDSAMTFINKNPQTSAGVLKARQQFDDFLLSQRKNILGDATAENALSIAAKEIRQTMNRLIQTRNPTTGVRSSLNRQTNMFRALDNIGPKAADEAGNIITRAWQNTLQILPFRGEFNQLMAAAFGIGGLGASALFAPFFTKGVFLGGFGFLAGKAITSPSAKRALAALIRQSDKAIKVATNPDMLRQLRTDRAFLVEMLKE